jgi:hypothetical protein
MWFKLRVIHESGPTCILVQRHITVTQNSTCTWPIVQITALQEIVILMENLSDTKPTPMGSQHKETHVTLARQG